MMLKAVLVLALAASAFAYDNGMGARPPMGWNTWCTEDLCGLRDKCTDSELRSVADAMVEQGLDKLGYEYLNMDDCWSDTSRDANGNLQPNAKQFPHGMKAMVDYVHSKGLKVGIYTCIGTETCRGGRPGSFGHYEQDAQTLASWGIDFVKTDNCNKPSEFTEKELFGNFSRALNATGRPMLFSLCEWGDEDVTQWGHTLAQMFRIQMDHIPFWSTQKLGIKGAGKGLGQGTIDIIEYVATINPSKWVKQFGWLDPDFLETTFHPTLSAADSRTEFSFWSLWSAPLIVATDVRNLHGARKEIITNTEVIAIDQDESFTAGERVWSESPDGAGAQIWSRPLANGDVAVLLFNGHNILPKDIQVKWEQVGLPSGANPAVRDLWQHKDLGNMQSGGNFEVHPHDVVFLRLSNF